MTDYNIHTPLAGPLLYSPAESAPESGIHGRLEYVHMSNSASRPNDQASRRSSLDKR